MSRFLNAKYKSLEPYTPGEQPKLTGRLIKLNTNENPYPPAPGVLEAINSEESGKLKLYSDPQAGELAAAIASYYGIDKKQVITGNGSDEILAFIFMALQGETGKIYYPQISYSFYPVYCDVFQAKAMALPLAGDFSIRAADYFDAEGTIVITNPNAPTGMALSLEEIESILRNNRGRPKASPGGYDAGNLVVIDEAYVDFGAESAVKLINEYDNLLVVQTFSKSRSLAGARIGFAMGSEDIISDLERIKFSFNPYNLGRLSILAGTRAMEDREYFNDICGRIIKTRQSFEQGMKSLGFKILPSKANFVFARNSRISGERYFNELRRRNIIVRHFKDEKICDYVRITIGTDEEMQILIEATAEILSKR